MGGPDTEGDKDEGEGEGEAAGHLHVRHTTWGSCKIQFGYAQKISNNFLKIQNTELVAGGWWMVAGACPTDTATKGRHNKQKRQKARNIIEWRPWRMWVRVRNGTRWEMTRKCTIPEALTDTTKFLGQKSIIYLIKNKL